MEPRYSALISFLKKYNVLKIICPSAIVFCIWNLADSQALVPSQFDILILKILDIVMIISLIVIIVLNIMDIVYRHHTGRSLIKDTIKYRKSYLQLFEYFKNADVHRIKPEDLPQKNWTEATGIIMGKVGDRLVEIPPSAGKNVIIFGIPKSGKTVALIATCIRYEGSIFAIDIKGDLYNAVANQRSVKIFSPSNPNISAHYNPLAGIGELDLDERKKFIKRIGQMIIPEQTGEGKFFSDGANVFWNGIVLYLLSIDTTINFPQIVEKILISDPITWVLTVKESNCKESQEYLNSLFGSNEKNVAGMYDCLCNALRPYNTDTLKTLLVGSDDCICTETLESGTDVYIQVAQHELTIYSELIRLITQQFIDKFMQRPDGANDEMRRPILMVLDEFSQLKKMPDIQVMLATLRSKNITAIIALQSREQLTKWYDSSGASEIIDCCAVIAFIQIQDVATRKWASDFIGTQKSLTVSTSSDKKSGRSRTVSENREYVYQPEAWGDLGKFRIVVSDSGRYIEADIVKYFE